MIEEQMHPVVSTIDTSLKLGCTSIYIVVHKKKFSTCLLFALTSHELLVPFFAFS
jgi:hypothetical protein